MKKEVTVNADDLELAVDIVAHAISYADDEDQRQKMRGALRAVIVISDEIRRTGSVRVNAEKK